MALPIYRYALDVTGENPDNHVSGERHSLIPKADLTDVRVFSPKYGPFFANHILRIFDRANGRQLVRGQDFKVTDLLQDPALKTGQDIGQFIVITNGQVSNEVEIHYQVLGGNYQNDATAVQHVFETFLNDVRPVDWANVSGKPLTYPPTAHLHLLEDVIGFGPLVVAIDNLRDAVLLNNTPMYEALIDWVNNRPSSWANVVDMPTTVDGYGITDAVKTTRRINTNALGGLQGGGTLANDLSLSLTDTGVAASTYGSAYEIPTFRVDNKGRLVHAVNVKPIIDWRDLTNRPTTVSVSGLRDAVSYDRRIDTSGGIQGGGDLSTNREFSLTNTGVIAGSYGDANTLPTFQVDIKGRIISAGRINLNLDWSRITGKPTTLAGYGITNGVDIGSWQQITGHKHFNSLHAALGSTAANPDNGATSRIATEDWVNRLITSKMGSGDLVNGVTRFTFGAINAFQGRGPNGHQVVYLPITLTKSVSFTSMPRLYYEAGGDNDNPSSTYSIAIGAIGGFVQDESNYRYAAYYGEGYPLGYHARNSYFAGSGRLFRRGGTFDCNAVGWQVHSTQNQYANASNFIWTVLGA